EVNGHCVTNLLAGGPGLELARNEHSWAARVRLVAIRVQRSHFRAQGAALPLRVENRAPADILMRTEFRRTGVRRYASSPCLSPTARAGAGAAGRKWATRRPARTVLSVRSARYCDVNFASRFSQLSNQVNKIVYYFPRSPTNRRIIIDPDRIRQFYLVYPSG